MKTWWRELAGALIVLAARIAALPLTPWSGEELETIAVLTGVEQRADSLFTILAKVAWFFAGDAFRGIVWLNVIASVASFVLLALALPALFFVAPASAGGRTSQTPSPAEAGATKAFGVAASLSVHLSASMLVFSTAALPDACALLCISAALFAWSRRNWWLLAAAVVGAALLMPLPVLERHPIVPNAVRFTLHPWGSKWITLPLLLCAAAGAFFYRRVHPLFVLCAAYLVFVILAGDPRDSVRAALPSMLLLATLAAIGLARLREGALIGALILGAMSFAYVWPVVRERRTTISPVVAAARHAASTLPSNAVVLYDLETRTPARLLLSQYANLPAEEGWAQYFDRAEVPMAIFAAGPTDETDATTLGTDPGDAHRKLFGEVASRYTIDPVRPAERFRPMVLVHPAERAASGAEWRWLGPDAALRLPTQHGPMATLIVKVSEDAPFAENDLLIGINGKIVSQNLATKQVSEVRFPLPDGPATVTIQSSRSFVPGGGDPRSLAVQLVDVEH